MKRHALDSDSTGKADKKGLLESHSWSFVEERTLLDLRRRLIGSDGVEVAEEEG